MNRRTSLILAIAVTLAACGTDSTTTETNDDQTNDAPESLADAGATVPGFDELTTVNFVDDSADSREVTADETELVDLVLADLNSLDYRWESDVVDIEVPAEQTGDVTSVLTYTATAWTTLDDSSAADARVGARVVYEMTVTNRVTTADGVVLDQAIVNDCLNLDFCPEGVSRETVTIERAVSFDRVDFFANCVSIASEDDEATPSIDCS